MINGQKNSHRHALWSENLICGRSDLWSIMGLRVRVPVCVVKLVFWWSADTPTPSQATGVWRTEWRTSIRFPHHIPSASHSRPSASPSASPTGKHTHDSETFTFTFMHLTDACIQSDLQARLYIFFCQYVCSLGIEPTTFCAANAMLYHWATRTRALQARRIPTRWVYSGRVRAVLIFWQIGLGSDSGSFSLSPFIVPKYVNTTHVYCMKYCYNNYIINIIHRLCNRQLRNAYMHALAYRWQLTMQSIREKLERGELLKVPNALGKAAFWQRFVCINICGHDCRWW